MSNSTSSQFFAAHLSSDLAARVAAANYLAPTPIQEQSIPLVLAGKDLLGLAQTGTGKTAAFVLPILERLGASKGTRHVRAVVLAPTRELAEQIHDTVKLFSARSGLRSTTVYGGVSMPGQVRTLRGGVDIVVACPGRLLDHLQQRTIDLSQVEVLVLDEADHMFDMGFLPTVRRILEKLPTQRQSLLFSATMPAEIRELALEILRNPATVQVSPTTPTSTVSHAIYPVQQSEKTAALLRLLSDHNEGSVLVFCRTKHRAKRIAEQCRRAGQSATCLQGNLSQNRRQEALDGFRKGLYRVMVATDIAARGIDVSSVTHVINYDIPSTVDAYTHRIGRTGRAARTGDAFTLVTAEDAAMVRSIERAMRARLERRTLEGLAPMPESEREPRDERPARQPRHGGPQSGRQGHKPARHPRNTGDRAQHSGPRRTSRSTQGASTLYSTLSSGSEGWIHSERIRQEQQSGQRPRPTRSGERTPSGRNTGEQGHRGQRTRGGRTGSAPTSSRQFSGRPSRQGGSAESQQPELTHHRVSANRPLPRGARRGAASGRSTNGRGAGGRSGASRPSPRW